MADEEMVRKTERELVEAAMRWAELRARNLAPLSNVEQRLYNAAVMLRSARRATGSFQIGKKE